MQYPLNPKPLNPKLIASILQDIFLNWILLKGLKLSYHNKETILFSVAPYYGNPKPLKEPL